MQFSESPDARAFGGVLTLAVLAPIGGCTSNCGDVRAGTPWKFDNPDTLLVDAPGSASRSPDSDARPPGPDTCLAEERTCDGIDDNCDGDIDEDFRCAACACRDLPRCQNETDRAPRTIGINFEDWTDFDHNDAVLCFRGDFLVFGDGSVLSRTRQQVTVEFLRNSTCEHDFEISLTHESQCRTDDPSPNVERSYPSDSRPRTFEFRRNSRLRVRLHNLSERCRTAAVVVFRPMLPFALSFAAGAMVYVVVEEVVPEAQRSGHADLATTSLIGGLPVMMVLDVALA